MGAIEGLNHMSGIAHAHSASRALSVWLINAPRAAPARGGTGRVVGYFERPQLIPNDHVSCRQ